MAPRTDSAPRHGRGGGGGGGGGGGERRNRNAHTGAGVNVNRSSAAGGRHGHGPRRGDTYRPRYHERRGGRQDRARNPAPSGRLVERMTFNDDRRRPAGGRDGGRGPAARPRPQQSGPIRRLQDRITHDDNANSEVSNEPPTCIAANNNSVDMIASSGLKLNPSQQFTMLLGSTQVEQYCPLLPVPPPGRRPVFSAQPIRMFNRPLDTPDDDNDDDELKCAPARPINTYRGKNEIKLMVQNPNLRAIFAGKPYPKERKKASGEKPVLRMGMSRELK